MNQNLKKSVRRSAFLFISFGFLLIGSLGLTCLIQSQSEERLNQQALVIVGELEKNLVESLVQLKDQENQKMSRFQRDKWIKNTEAFKAKIEQLVGLPSQGHMGSEKIANLYYSSRWSLDESIQHHLKLQLSLEKKLKAKKEAQFKLLKKDLMSGTPKVLDLFKPFKQQLKNNLVYLIQVENIILGVVASLFALLLMTVYFVIYSPWKRSYRELELEKGTLQEVLKESELRGNTFSWELNYQTKETNRSNYLSGIYELEEENDVFYLYDEVALLTPEHQERFMMAIDSCALKGEVMDIQVSMQTRNKKVYWFHYYAKRVEQDKKVYVKGTVRDISQHKLAEERFEKIFSAHETPCLIFGEGQIRSMNEAALQFMGVDDVSHLDKLHPAILFPLYQMDGNSSLDKLKKVLDEVRSGKTSTEDWTFQTYTKRDIVCRTTIVNLPYPESELFLMIVTDNSQRVSFERRLVDANRRALHARRLKLEYVTQVGIILQDTLEVLKEQIRSNDSVDLGHHEKLVTIENQLQALWKDNLSESFDEGSHIMLTNLEELLRSFEARWNSLATETGNEFHLVFPPENERFFWLDSSKLRLALLSLVEGALSHSKGSKIELSLESKFSGGRNGKLNITLKNTNLEWPGKEWRKLVVNNNRGSELQKREPLSLANFFNIIEILQGEIFFDKGEFESIVGFQFHVERAVGISEEEVRLSVKNSKMVSKNTSQLNISASDIWSHFGGDWDIIENTIKDFLDYYPTAVADMLYFLRVKNSEGLADTAADLYGVLSHFPFFKPIERVVLIQKYSRFLKFDKVEEEIEALSYDLTLFSRALQEFLPDDKPIAA